MADLPLDQVIAQYIADADLPARSIAGLTREELLAFPIPGTWSIQQIVLHLMDSDLIGSDRMKRVIAEENPSLIGYDETAFANKLHYELMDVATACEVFKLNRLLTGTLLKQLPESIFQRTGTHSQYGLETLETLVRSYVEHAQYHVTFITRKKALLRGTS